MACADLRAELLCSICQEVYKDPMTLLCGHNFCADCISRTWDHQYEGEYFCPTCQVTFRRRPESSVNTTLKNIAELFQRSHEQEDTGIFCTFCDIPISAVTFCLRCETSLCGNHLRKHNKMVDHTLVCPEMSSKVKKCVIHKKMSEYYCAEERSFLCSSCVYKGEHVGHKVETITEASEKKKEKLRRLLDKLTSQREETEQTIVSVLEQVRRGQEKMADLTEKAKSIFRNVRRQLEDLENKVMSEISKQSDQRSPSISDLIQHLDIKDEISRKITKIEELCDMDNPMTVLQEDIVDLSLTEEEDTKAEDGSGALVGDLDESLIIETLHRGLSEMIKYINIRFYIQEPSDISLDPESAANNIDISGDLKTVLWSHKGLRRLETSQRFEYYQVLSTRSFSRGQHYWDVETSPSGSWRLGVCYPSSDRKGDRSLIGDNKKSWSLSRLCLRRWFNKYSLRHGGEVIQVSSGVSSCRFRVYLDYEAGQLSFYELSDPIRHLYTFTVSFTEPLHAVFYVWGDWWYKDSWVRIL